MILFKDNDDYYLNLFDLNFAQDLVERKFTVKIEKGYELFDLLTDKVVSNREGVFYGAFEKYAWFVLKKI